MPQLNSPVNPNVPDAYITNLSPRTPLVGDVQTDLIGFVGTATWGPVGAPMAFSTPSDFISIFGAPQARKYDMGTQVAAACLVGAKNHRGVRVTDGTETAASIIVLTNCITFTSKYPGTGANADTVQIAAGSAASTTKVIVSRPGRQPEVFDNIAGAAGALWVNIAAAINNGQSGIRGASELIVATAGAGTTAPTLTTYALTGGTDGVATLTAAVLLGLDTGTRKGMYALRGTGPGMLVLADADDSTSWAAQVAFALAEGFYALLVGPSGEYTNPATVAANKATAGIDSYGAKLLVGDWVYFTDPTSGLLRLIAPQGFAAASLAVIGPEQSGLNKQIPGVVGTQKTAAAQVYSIADLSVLGAAGLDLITNPCPGGRYFGLRYGRNTSSNAAINGDNYSRMIPYLAARAATVAGQFVGQLQTADQRRQAVACFDAWLHGEFLLGRISNPQGTQPYSIQLDDDNNPPNRVALGYEQVDLKIQLGPVIVFFVLNIEAGQTVQVKSTFTT